jgi:hypothetical protein
LMGSWEKLGASYVYVQLENEGVGMYLREKLGASYMECFVRR